MVEIKLKNAKMNYFRKNIFKIHHFSNFRTINSNCHYT